MFNTMMRRLACHVGMVMLIMHVFAFHAASKEDDVARIAGRRLYADNRVIVKFKKYTAAKSVHKMIGGTVAKRLQRLQTDLVSVPAGQSVRDAIRLYQADPNVAYAEPDYLVRKASIPNDLLFGSQWNMLQIAAPQAWSRFSGSNAPSSKIIAVLDTGIDYSHSDLVANLWTNPGEIPDNGIDDDGNGIVDDVYGANFKEGFPTTGNPMDDDTADSHGTHVAGIIGAAGNNAVGVAGLNWQARIMGVKFLHGADGYGELSDALLGFEYALAQGASIINCSFEVSEDPSLTAGIRSLRDAVVLANALGALVVSAAGNTGSDLERYNVYPASIIMPNNLSVAATGSNDQFPGYSDYGRSVVHVAAPGGDRTNTPGGVLSTVYLTGFANELLLYRTTAGTSMAAPHVSGLALLIWNLYPNLSAYQIKARIMNSVDRLDSLSDKVMTGGRINAERALTIADIPAVFSLLPARALPGMKVVINGANFGNSSGTITLNSMVMTVDSWSDTSITAVVPQSALSGNITVNGLGSSSFLTVPVLPDITISAEPAGDPLPLTQFFAARLSRLDSVFVKYEWDFGDGIFRVVPGVNDHAEHTFDQAGRYIVRIRMTDEFGQMVIGETTATVGQVSSNGSGGGCFIATAAYGSYLHPRVAALRNFRDRYLMTSYFGRLFVKGYYAVSPPLAEWISHHDGVRAIVRCGLYPLVLLAEHI